MNRRHLVELAVLATFPLLCGFAWGRCTAPRPQVTVQEHEDLHQVEHVAEVARADVRTEVRTIAGPVRWRTRIVHASGDVEERVVEAGPTTTETHAAAATVRDTERRTETVRTIERRVEVRTPLPDWKLSALVGLALDGAPAYGAAASRRILGPIHVGAWALAHPGALGVSVGVEW